MTHFDDGMSDLLYSGTCFGEWNCCSAIEAEITYCIQSPALQYRDCTPSSASGRPADFRASEATPQPMPCNPVCAIVDISLLPIDPLDDGVSIARFPARLKIGF
jgi:hypothetical protein